MGNDTRERKHKERSREWRLRCISEGPGGHAGKSLVARSWTALNVMSRS